MAENKKSFILYVDIIHTVKHLTDEQAGKLFKHVLSYCNDENPVSDDVITNVSFEPIKQALKRDLKKYENYIEKQKANGRKGGRPKAKKPNPLFENPTKAKKADSVSVSDSDINTNVLNVRQIDIYILELKSQEQFLEGLYMTHKFKPKVMGKLALRFKEHLKMFPKQHENFINFRNHFKSWVDQQVRNNKLGEYLKHQKGEL